MATSYFSGPTLDDVMRSVTEEITLHGESISPTKGAAAELTGVLIEITNPMARLSRTETRGKPFSCLGELCWYLAKSNSLDFISYYLPQYRKSAENGLIFGGYGPRLFDWAGQDQVANVTHLLRRKRDSRQAVIQLFDADDIAQEHLDVPCTCMLQFMIRRDSLHMMTYMRSNDAFMGLPHDVFCFSMLQEIVARDLGVELGTYKHAVGSLHLYDVDRARAQQFMDEGWQSTKTPMPPMPIGDPWSAINAFCQVELTIRTANVLDVGAIKGLDPYWLDLIRLLQVYGSWKRQDANEITKLRTQMSSNVYHPFIDSRLQQLKVGRETESSSLTL